MLIGLKKDNTDCMMKIPQILLKDLGWDDAEDVIATIQDGKLVLSKAPSRRVTKKHN